MKTILNHHRFFRDAANAKVSGVCAGLAKQFDVNPWLVRGGAIFCFVLLPVATALAYVLAILLLRYR
jgi:phage shock protein PspC (stress-responsive transcriptional regulator)